MARYSTNSPVLQTKTKLDTRRSICLPNKLGYLNLPMRFIGHLIEGFSPYFGNRLMQESQKAGFYWVKPRHFALDGDPNIKSTSFDLLKSCSRSSSCCFKLGIFYIKFFKFQIVQNCRRLVTYLREGVIIGPHSFI